jgi:CRP-like cAMP-binding protein/rhodanese-related sulfurtransferase
MPWRGPPMEKGGGRRHQDEMPMAEEIQKYAQQISQLIPICELPTQIQNEVIKNANLLKVRKGSFIFKQGDRDEYSFYVIEGEIELHANNQLHNTIAAGTDRSRYAMAQLQPRQFSARARTSSVVLQISRDYLDKLLVLHEKEDSDNTITKYDLATAEVEVSDLAAEDDIDWMTRMLQSELFSRMPTANIQALFASLEAVEFKAGDVVIRQGDPGEDYFIIQEGRCQVLRAPPSGGKDIKLAELHAGDSFGEEALITDTTRNATVSMLTDGVLMRLSKDNFINLIKKPTLQAVSYGDAVKLVETGARWLDVRFKNEHDTGAFPDSINIPLNVLRMQIAKLDPTIQYVAYCDTGGRSSTAAFLLAGRGIRVCFLQGGLVNAPTTAISAAAPAPQPESKKAPAPEPMKTPAPKVDAPKGEVPEPATPPPAPEPVAEAPASDEELDPHVKASVLEAELARTNAQLDVMEKRRQEIQDRSQQEIQAEIERRLQEERAKIEQAKREAEEEARRLREREEERLREMKEQAEKRLQDEKKKLEAVYSRNAEEMEKLQRMKQETEEQMRLERQRLEQEAGEARRQMEEAKALQKQIEASRRAMEKEAQKRMKEQAEMERRAQQEARSKLEAERRKLAEQFARNNEELEKAKQERAEADASRQAAREEAARIIAEYKTKHEEARAIEEARLQAERAKLEEEQKKIRDSLREIEAARQQAEEARRAAMAEVETLKAKAREAAAVPERTGPAPATEDVRIAEAKLDEANRNIAQMQQAREKAEQAQKINEEDLAQRKLLEEEMRKQLEADLNQFKEDLEEQEKKFTSVSSQMEHMRRIKERADAAKKATRAATDSLLSDVASQLGEKEK